MSTVTPAKTYTVTINVAGRGAPTTGESGESRAGHMWYSLGDGTKEESYGFGPIEQEASGPGELKRNDNALYPERYSRTITRLGPLMAKSSRFPFLCFLLSPATALRGSLPERITALLSRRALRAQPCTTLMLPR